MPERHQMILSITFSKLLPLPRECSDSRFPFVLRILFSRTVTQKISFRQDGKSRTELDGSKSINNSWTFVLFELWHDNCHFNDKYAISVGQCGNQIGGAFWPLALHEHGIKATSSGMNFLKTQRDHVKHMDDLSDAFDSFFHVPGDAKQLSFKEISDLVTAKVKARVYKTSKLMIKKQIVELEFKFSNHFYNFYCSI